MLVILLFSKLLLYLYRYGEKIRLVVWKAPKTFFYKQLNITFGSVSVWKAISGQFKCTMCKSRICTRLICINNCQNLDKKMRHCVEYRHLFNLLNESKERLKLYQIVEFDTWQKVINNSKKH